MSNAALSWAFPLPIMGAKKAVLVALAEHANEAGRCWPSLERLALFAGVTVRAVRREIGTLIRLGLLQADRSRGRVTSRYQLNVGTPFGTVCPRPDGSRGPDRPLQTINGHSHDHVPFPDPEPPTRTESPGSDAQPGLRVRPTRTQSPPNPHRTLKKEERKEVRAELCSASREREAALSCVAVLPMNVSPHQVATQLMAAIPNLGVRSARATASLLGKFRQAAADDCEQVVSALRRAIRVQPADPVAFVFGCLRPRRTMSKWDQIHAELGTRSLLTIDFDPEPDEPAMRVQS